jgi:uncharacterized membrane-anchored protein
MVELLLAIIILQLWSTKIQVEILFFLAIILTHPVGLIVGHYLTKSESSNLVNIVASVVFVGVFIKINYL